MIELLADMPEGVTGIRVSGRLRGIRIVEVIASDYEGFGRGGLVEDPQGGLRRSLSPSFGVQANRGSDR
jgi:hypothetical protein